MKKFYYLTILFLLFFVVSANSQTPKITVKVEVNADVSLKTSLESYINRELRQLGDIDLYSTKPDISIVLVAVNAGDVTAVSIVVYRNYNWENFIDLNLKSTSISVQARKSLIETLAVQNEVVRHEIKTSSTSDLDQLCKRIVASIDTDIFERDRRLNKYLASSSNSNAVKTPPPPPPSIQPKTTQQPKDNQPVFERRYVGDNKPPRVEVFNDSDTVMNFKFGENEYIIVPKQTKTIETTNGGLFNFVASATGVRSLSGQHLFERGYVYTWRFYIVTERR